MASVIPGVATTPSTTTTTPKTSVADAATASLNYDSFLKLFMTELQNQDPTSPMDTTQQMSQLATFSQVEQQIKTNTNLTSLLSQNSLTTASSLIGKTVTNSTGDVTGVVENVKLTDTATTITLTNGQTIDVSKGVTISATPAPTTTTTQ
jgi:flagellar basal-body rod modification protein FlgD